MTTSAAAPSPCADARPGLSVIGIDASLTAAGVCTRNGPQLLKPPKGHDRGVQRLAWFRRQLEALVRVLRPEVAVIEGYSFASVVGGERLGELGGVIRLTLHDAGVPYVEVPPSSLKIFGTGKGNAAKGAMLTEAVRRLGYTGSDDNEADALWLHALGMWAYGSPVVELPKTHLRGKVLEIEWPRLHTHPGR